MKLEEFEQLLKEEVLPECMKIMDSKGLAYSGQEDKLGNFKRIAKMAGVSAKLVWFVYFCKHVDAIASFVRDEYKDSESIEGRLNDVINYGFLGHGLVRELRKLEDLGRCIMDK